MLAGGAATGTEISHWLGGFSTFLFLSLAMVKRFSELENLRERGAVVDAWPRVPGGRPGADTNLRHGQRLRGGGRLHAVHCPPRRDRHSIGYAGRLWLLVPLLLYWITRIWLLASRGELDDDPVIFAIRDRMSLLVGVGILVVAWLAI